MRTLASAITLAPILAMTAPAVAQDVEPATPSSVVASASAEDWVTIAPEDLLVMELAPDAEGNRRTVVIQLMPPPFSQPWVENIRMLARAHWWDGTSVNRVQDNYVTQWGDVTEEKELPERVVSPEAPYSADFAPGMFGRIFTRGEPREEQLRITPRTAPSSRPTDYTDAYSDAAGFVAGFPAAMTLEFSNDARMLSSPALTWPIHCYGYVGVGRGYAPDTGTGADLYTIIGQPQRHMDRNLAVVGRVIEGMEHLSSLPRGSGDLGFYTEIEAHLRTPIVSVRLASEIENPPSFEYLDTSSESFARYVAVRANRDDAFYTVPAGGVDICSVQVPVRRVTE